MSEPKRRRSDWPVWVCIALVMIVAYGGAYVAIVKKVHGTFSGHSGTIYTSDEWYCENERMNSSLRAVFWPAHQIDVRVRYRRWHDVFP